MADTIALNLYVLKFAELSKFGGTIYEGFIRLAADYPSPKPTMSIFRGHIDKLDGAITEWGSPGNRGAHKDHLTVLSTANRVRKGLQMLSDYAINTQPDNPNSWADLGFPLRKPKSKNQPLEMVQDFRHFISRAIPAGNHKLKWKRPLNTKTNLVRGYIIQANDTSEYPKDPKGRILMNVIGIVTETSFIDMNPLPGINWYWVTPFNSAGLGVTSNMVMVMNTRVVMEE